MRKGIILIAILAYQASYIGVAQTPKLQFVKTLGGLGNDGLLDLCHDNSGNILITGYFSESADLDMGLGDSTRTSNGESDILVQKLDDNGNLIWMRTFGGAGYDRGRAICIGKDNSIYLMGSFDGTVDFGSGLELKSQGKRDIFILKLDTNGKSIWAINMGGTRHDLGTAMRIDDNDNLYTTGYFYFTADFESGNGKHVLTCNGTNDIFVHKVNSNGQVQWAKHMGGYSVDVGHDLRLDKENNIYITGEFKYHADFDPGSDSSKTYGKGFGDIFLLKLDSLGGFQWVKTWSSRNLEIAYSLAIDENENIYLTGNFTKETDLDPDPIKKFMVKAPFDTYGFFLLGLNKSGDFKWARSFGELPYNQGQSLIYGNSGRLIVCGHFSGSVDIDGSKALLPVKSKGVEDILIASYDTSGNALWAASAGGLGNDRGFSVTMDKKGDVVLGGIFSKQADFDPGKGEQLMTSHGAFDLFLQKMSLGTATDVTSLRQQSLTLYPNPNSGVFTLSLPYEGWKAIDILSLDGRLVASYGTLESNEGLINGPQKPGIYFLRAISNRGDVFFGRFSIK